MSDEEKKDPPENEAADGEDEDEVLEGEVETGNLVALTGGLIHTEVVEDDEANSIRHRILEISRRVDDDKLELGQLFFRVRVSALYTKWADPTTGKPFQRWEDYVEQETSFSLRSISHMVAIWYWFSALQSFPRIRELIREVGWRKAAVLVGIADDSNFAAWFSLAKEKPRPELELNAKAAMAKAGISRRPSLLQKPSPKSSLPAPEVEVVVPPETDSKNGITFKDVAEVSAKLEAERNPADKNPAKDPVVPTVPIGENPRKGVDRPTQGERDDFAETRRPWTALMNETQKQFVESAIDAVYDVLKESSDMTKRPASDQIGRGLALEMMSTHVLAFYTGANAVNKDLRSRLFFRDIMKGLETNFGVNVIAIDAKKGTLLYGLGEQAFEALEAKLGVDIIAIKKGTNECVYGLETAQRFETEAATNTATNTTESDDEVADEAPADEPEETTDDDDEEFIDSDVVMDNDGEES